METALNSTSWPVIIAVLGAVVVMLGGGWLVFARLEKLSQGFGPNSLKALGIILFLPILLLLAILTNFKTETLAALLGTVAGYVLSSNEETKTKNNLNKSKEKPDQNG